MALGLLGGYKIHCFGDSHISLFCGNDRIVSSYPEVHRGLFKSWRICHLGPVLAYSLHKNDTRTRGREKFLQKLTVVPKDHYILACFGEIDTRFHLPKKAAFEKKSLEDVVEECVDKYIGFLNEISRTHPKIIVYNVVPTSNVQPNNPEFPHYGKVEVRRSCVELFNQYLRKKCRQHEWGFLDVYNKIARNDGSVPHWAFFDNVHLSKRILSAVKHSLYQTLTGRTSKWNMLLWEFEYFWYDCFFFIRKTISSLKQNILKNR